MVVRVASIPGLEAGGKGAVALEEGLKEAWLRPYEVEHLLNPELRQPEDSPVLPLVASALESLVEVNEHKDHMAMQAASPGDARVPRLTVFHGLHAPPITIEAYLLRIAKYAKCSPACFVAALGYMRRLAALDTALAPNSLNVHRLLLTGVLLGAKFLDDRYYNNAFYAKVGGISTPELNRLELEMLKLLQFRLSVTPESLAAQLAQLHSGSWVLDACSFPTDTCLLAAAARPPADGVGAKGDACMTDAEARLFGRKRRSIGASVCDVDARRLQRRSMEQVAA